MSRLVYFVLFYSDMKARDAAVAERDALKKQLEVIVVLDPRKQTCTISVYTYTLTIATSTTRRMVRKRAKSSNRSVNN